jgi:hypothetical protein
MRYRRWIGAIAFAALATPIGSFQVWSIPTNMILVG